MAGISSFKRQSPTIVLCLFVLLWTIPVLAHPQTSSAKDEPTASSSSPSKPAAAEIAAAKAAGKVWVNLNTGIYHRKGRWYGKTKNGKFMTLDEARKAGYKAAKRE
jgi:hypothetical protein